MGVERPPLAGDCLNALLKELSLNAEAGNIKVALIVDGINPLFFPNTYVCKDWDISKRRMKSAQIQRRLCKMDELSVMRALRKFVANPKVAVFTSVGYEDKVRADGDYINVANPWLEFSKDMRPNPALGTTRPFELLGDYGWRALHPFLPVEVGAFSKAEMDFNVDYCIERGLLANRCKSEASKEEIQAMTAGNGFDFTRFSAYW